MSVVLRIVDCPGIVLSGQAAPIGEYIEDFDVEPYPFGTVTTTPDKQDAKRFANMIDALDFWKQEVGELRDDGKPNRPLSALSVEVENV